MNFKLGRNRPVSDHPHLKLARYLDKLVLPAPPAQVSYAAAAEAALSQMYLNSTLGDCVIAGMCHLVGLFTGNAGNTPVIFTDAQVTSLYSKIGGYVPGNPDTDQGCDEVTALHVWIQDGLLSGADPHKALGYVTIDPANKVEVAQAQWLFENLFFGIELPDPWTQVTGSGFTWDVGTPDPANGHCVVGVGYNAQGVQIATWGMIGTITWGAMAANVGPASGGNLYAVLSLDSIAKATAKAPNGFNAAQLIGDLNALGANIPVPPVVVIPPPSSPTKAQVLATVTMAIDNMTWPA